MAGYFVIDAFKRDDAQLSRRLGQADHSLARRGEVSRLVLSALRPNFGSTSSSASRAERELLFELPDFIELLALGLRAGDDVHGALARILPRLNGALEQRFSALLAALDLGASLSDELGRLAEQTSSRPLQEFANKLAQALRRGTPLATVMTEQAESVRATIRNELLKQAGKNETRMLIPLVFLILPVTVVFAVFPSLQLLQLGLF